MNRDDESPTELKKEGRRWSIQDLLVLGVVAVFAAVGVIIALGKEIERLLG